MGGSPLSCIGRHNKIPPTDFALSMKENFAVYSDSAANQVVANREMTGCHNAPHAVKGSQRLSSRRIAFGKTTGQRSALAGGFDELPGQMGRLFAEKSRLT